MTPLEIATIYIRRGWSPVPVPLKQKGPTLPGWQQLRLDEENAAEYFDRSAQNIGVLLGPSSGGTGELRATTGPGCAQIRRLEPGLGRFSASSR